MNKELLREVAAAIRELPDGEFFMGVIQTPDGRPSDIAGWALHLGDYDLLGDFNFSLGVRYIVAKLLLGLNDDQAEQLLVPPSPWRASTDSENSACVIDHLVLTGDVAWDPSDRRST